jgi:GT2 family glycosyltransferase
MMEPHQTTAERADLGIVILNWNTRALLEACLATVAASAPALAAAGYTARVIVVDNASADGSADQVAAFVAAHEAAHPHGPITFALIARTVNDGYPSGNNVGLRALGFTDRPGTANRADAPRYALLLNPDTELPPDALATMTAYMDAHPAVGVAGPKLVLPDGQLDKACKRGFPTPWVSLYHFAGLGRLFPHSPRFARYNMSFIGPDEEADVDSVVGAYMQVRAEAIAAVGLLDERFFMYAEDIDWACRTAAAGWKTRYVPRVVVRHVKRAASRQSQRAQFEFWRAMLLFYRKHYQRATPLPLHALIMAALAVKGGRALWPEIRQAEGAARA